MVKQAYWRNASLAFTAGALGAIANRIALWLLGLLAVIPPTRIAFPLPEPVKLWFYSAIVWGGLWGFLFLIPWRASWWLRGIVLGFGPSLGVWLVIYPYVAHVGFFGASRGVMALVIPFLVNNIVWGMFASWWYEFTGARAATARG
ncbi:MAG: hypothetical protein IH605_10740 [Burkholderiales bacterium]|nr:hypothetical protein [Burkholderiales bacterium]